jgi:hypothetical protein
MLHILVSPQLAAPAYSIAATMVVEAAQRQIHVFASPDHVCGHDLSWRATAALERVVIDERLLHGMQCRTRRAQTFDRSDLAPGAHDRKRQARENAAIVQVHGACSTLAMAAALFFVPIRPA